MAHDESSGAPPSQVSGWVCSACRRRVPRQIATCRCGAERPAAPVASSQPDPAPPVADPSAGREWAAVGVLTLVVMGLGYVHVSRRPEPPPDNQPVRRASVPAKPRPQRLPPPSVAVVDTATPPARPSPPPRRVEIREAPISSGPFTEVSRAGPKPFAGGSERSTTDDARRKGLADLNAGLSALAQHAHALGKNLERYETWCVGQKFNLAQVGNCEEVRDSLREAAAHLSTSIEELETRARRAFVQPGDLRQAWARFAVEEWEETIRRTAEVAR